MKIFNKTSITAFFLCLSIAVLAQSQETRDLDKFSELRVSEGIELIAKKGNTNSIEIEVSRIDIDRVVTEVRGDRLSVHLRRNFNSRSRRVRATLTYTEELEAIIVNTGAEASFEDMLKTDRLRISTSTSGTVDAKIDVKILDISASTSGNVDLVGDAEEVEATASTGGTIRAEDVEADDVYARANTGADVRVHARETLRASAGTGGTVSYKGRPRTDKRTNTGGSVRRY